ncbi:hypothetical protein FWH13_01315 [Candidatus Saccharibacteria bacterium]|nr:hypothetical protein [Candidatus Saccharibacteria bacterium]
MSKLVEMLSAIEGCELDFISRVQTRDKGGVPKGRLNDVGFLITFERGKYLMLTVHCEGVWEPSLNVLLAQCVEFMGAEPICQYDESNPARTTIEWDLIDPENRLSEIVNGGGVFAQQKIENVVLFGERKLADYENEDAKKANAYAEAERIKNARIYGIDAGSCDVERIKVATEWELFLEYYSITKVAWYLNHDGSRDHSRGRISDKDWDSMQDGLAEMQYDIEYLMYAIAKKIGIDVPEPEVDKHILPDREMFTKWYRFYDNHFMHTLSDGQKRAFEAKCKKGEDVSEYLPSGNWRESE